MKYKLYSTESAWNTRHASVMEALGIPTANGNTTTYAEITQVENESHADHGKFLFPVITSTANKWKCDQLFSGGLVDPDPNWWNMP